MNRLRTATSASPSGAKVPAGSPDEGRGVFADLLAGARSAIVMGVVNVTPDSFSDGGVSLAPDRAFAHAARLIAEGAAIVDVGGESTRPGAPAVAAEEERRRVVPVIRRIARELGATISIDTTKRDVAAAALDAGAVIVNDISAGRADREMLRLVASARAGMVLMHRQGMPRTMQRRPRYREVVSDVRAHLARRLAAAERAGIPRANLAIDPGIGFGKTLAHNLSLLRRLREIVTLGAPVLIGVSRKAFLGRILDLPVGERVEGTVAASLLAVERGARIVRVHDVAAMVRAIAVADAIRSAP